MSVVSDSEIKPKVVQEWAVDSDPNVRFRRTMEDRHLFDDSIGMNNDIALLCIFDGHGGEVTADFLKNNFKKTFLERDEKNNDENMLKILRETFVQVDSDMSQNEYDGATGAVVVIQKKAGKTRIYSANCGDARCVLVKSDSTGVRLSFDHKPNLPEEVERIQTNGGFVTWGRVNAILAVSRSFGDHVIKNLVISEPFLSERDMEPNDEYIIVACDGLWDVVNDNEAAQIVMLAGNAKTAATNLKLAGLEKGTTDNISVMVVKL